MFKGYKELQKTKISEAYDSGKNDEATTRPDFGTKFKDIPKAVWLLVCHSLIHIKTCSFRHLHHVSILMQYFILFYFILPGDKNIIWDRCIMFFWQLFSYNFQLKNPTFVFIMLGATIELLVVGGLAVFGAKLIHVLFNVDLTTAGSVMGKYI